MCGITGYLHFDKLNTVNKTVLESMCQALHHRGPDELGYFIQDDVGFGFTRLSINDLDNGHQPLYNEDSSIILVCNGEIFNHQELRLNLIKKGHHFRTKCDIEVILHLYEEYGVDCLKHLNGQFAFAIYDLKQQTLFLARDHFGILPLFYSVQNQQQFVFASEIKSILEHPSITREVDLTGLDQILSFPGLISPQTMFKGIKSLPAGHYMIVQQAQIKSECYWDLDYPKIEEATYPYSEQDYIERLRELLTQSVIRRLKADVPVGYYLSGGMDSSIIAAMIDSIDNHNPRHSFSIGFTDRKIDESKFQNMMLKQVQSIHHQMNLCTADIAQDLKSAIYYAECPLKETYNTASLALSRSVHSNGIKAVLSGEGADELFAGYVGYRFDQLNSVRNTRSAISDQERQLRLKLWGDADILYERNLVELGEQKSALYSEGVQSQLSQFDCLQFEVVNNDKLKDRHIVHQRSYLDFKLRLSDHLLSDHGDRMAMANSVEVRYPFLDVPLVEFAKTIPPHLKINNFKEKYILKQIAADLIPQEIINRDKFGFVAPSSAELLKLNLNWVNELLSFDTIKKQGYFNPYIVEELKVKYQQPGFKLKVPYESDMLIIILSFGIFLEQFSMPDF